MVWACQEVLVGLSMSWIQWSSTAVRCLQETRQLVWSVFVELCCFVHTLTPAVALNGAEPYHLQGSPEIAVVFNSCQMSAGDSPACLVGLVKLWSLVHSLTPVVALDVAESFHLQLSSEDCSITGALCHITSCNCHTSCCGSV